MAPTTKQASSRDLRHRVLTCLTRLSDRDTQALAVAELESIIPTLTGDTFSLFITSVSSTSTADKPSVRGASLRLLSSLSSTHRANLSHHLPKLVSAAIRRLRDPDSAVRASCVSAFASFASDVATTTSFSASILRPLAESLSTEQDASAQSAAALCLAAAIDSSPAPDPAQIAKFIPKWMKLLKSDGFKAKPGLLTLLRSVVRACEIGNGNMLRDLVATLVDFLKRDDWAARKAAAEALAELAVVERDCLSELKASSLKTFESRRFDKVKAAREAMNKMVEVWKEIPDVLEDGSPPPQSQASSKENASDGRYPLRSHLSSIADSNTPQSRRNLPLRRISPSESATKTTARNRSSLENTQKTSSPPVFKKLDYKKNADQIIDNYASHGSCVTSSYDESHQGFHQRIFRRGEKESTKSPNLNSSGAIVDINVDQCRHNHRECEDLSAIRQQLGQIESQQSGLMDLLQTFIRTSQDGMRSLETRVNGLETALTDMSYDLAVSTTRMARSDPPRNSCCLLPSSDFLSSKFWRRSVGEQRRFSFPITTSSVATVCETTVRSPVASTYKPENKRFQRHVGAGGFIVNPLAETQADSRRFSEMSSTGFSRGVHNAA